MSTLVTREAPEFLVARDQMTPLSIFEEMDRLAQDIQKRAFSFFEERGGSHGFDHSDWFRAESELLRPMPIEVAEHEKEVVVRAEVPGFDAKELSVTVEPFGVRVYGKTEKREKECRTDEKAGLRHYTEISSNEVLREIALPTAVNPEQAAARLEKGVLEIRLPRAAPPKLIDVKTA